MSLNYVMSKWTRSSEQKSEVCILLLYIFLV